VGTRSIWKSAVRLADGREIIYFNEAPGLGRNRARDTRNLPPLPPRGRDRAPPVRRAPSGTVGPASGRPAEYLAGTESGMGVWINDIGPEEAAQRLREA
jgi:hypothetical protein